jgi:hypothetical protein
MVRRAGDEGMWGSWWLDLLLGLAAGLLLAYLAFPVDLVPGFVPVLGYADDAIIVAAVLRWVVRRAGVQAVQRQWPGTADGFAVLCRLAGLTPPNLADPVGQQPSAPENCA